MTRSGPTGSVMPACAHTAPDGSDVRPDARGPASGGSASCRPTPARPSAAATPAR